MAFRAFYAIGGMSNSQGLPTNALFGFTNMLLKLIRDERPDYLAITWDPKGGSFRDRDYPDYKGTRSEMPDALRAQMPHFSRIAEAFDVPYLCIEDFEADDVMGTLARRHEDAGELMAEWSVIGLPELEADALSGGNAQKLVAAREMEHEPDLVLAFQPTRGLDPGATSFLRQALLDMTSAGSAVLWVSADLDELLAVSDRIKVMFGGKIAGEFSPPFDRAAIGLAMAGMT